MNNLKKVEAVLTNSDAHWVGDGFPVSTIVSPQNVGNRLSPFILMDYAGPVEFEPADRPRGVDSHPHRGFETVTVVYQGELEHRDSGGNSGSIGPGDVQWMTAASGVLHEEKHSRDFTRRGGAFEVIQLWVNLPAKFKMTPPRYQTLLRDAIPVVQLPDNAGSARIIAGEFDSNPGAARTVTPVILWDVSLRKGAQVKLPIPDGFNSAVFVRTGQVRLGGTHTANERELVLLERQGDGVIVEAQEDAQILVLGGQPIDEPVVAYGPFVMNTPEEIRQAMADVHSGKLGSLD
ncbi:MAG TPA: pirin family protein [Phycisphaerae bacterium]|nr:pirin family protein [Phycisphaerae bacterium]